MDRIMKLPDETCLDELFRDLEPRRMPENSHARAAPSSRVAKSAVASCPPHKADGAQGQISRTGPGSIQPKQFVAEAQPVRWAESTPAGEGAELAALVEPQFLPMWPWPRLNRVQSLTFGTSFMSDRSLLVVSPTGTGKTVVAELCVVGRMQRNLLAHAAGDAGSSASTLIGGKMVYLAPMTALCTEKATDWKRRFGALGIKVATLSGEAPWEPHEGPVPLPSSSSSPAPSSITAPRLATRQDVLSADVICTTPERWDALTRRWKDHIGLVGRVSILVIDEVHHVGSTRGPALESIVSRMVSSMKNVTAVTACVACISFCTRPLLATLSDVQKTVASSEAVVKAGMPAAKMRIVGLAATLRNYGDVAAWLDVQQDDVVRRTGCIKAPLLCQLGAGVVGASDCYTRENGVPHR